MRACRTIASAVTALAAIATLASTALAAAPPLRRYPYLTDTVGSAATVNFGTDRTSTRAAVKWGRQGVESCTAHTAAATRTAITVNGVAEYQWTAPLDLAADTAYCYRVYLEPSFQGQSEIDLLAMDAAPSFRTQVPAGSAEPFSFAVFGDWGQVDASGANADQANVLAGIAASGARFAFTTGDNAYPSGSQDNYGDLQQTGANLSGVFGPTFWTRPGRSVPVFPAIGNHGLNRADANHPHLLNWPQTRAVAASGGRYARDTYCCKNGTPSTALPSTWYAFSAGKARFYVLDAAWPDNLAGNATPQKNDFDYHWAQDAAEYKWLQADLAAHQGEMKFAVLHYPMYSDNATEGSDSYLRGKDKLEGLLNRYGTTIAFTGHSHVYERNTAVKKTGVVNYVTGGGGAAVEPIGAKGCSPWDAYGIGWSFSRSAGSACGAATPPASVSQVFHFLLVTISGATVTVTPTDSTGRTFDVKSY